MLEHPDRKPASSRGCWRLTFRFDGLKFELVRRQRVAMIAAPATGQAPQPGKHAGTWLELRGKDGEALYHHDLRRLIGVEAEIFDPSGTVKHVMGQPGRGQFEVVVPDLPNAMTVHFFSSPFEERKSREPAGEVAQFELRPPGAGPQGE